MKTNARIMVAMIIGTLAAGCGQTAGGLTPQPARAERIMDELEAGPSWIREDCRSQVSRGSLCAVGAVAGVRNPGLAREAAELRGQTGISRQMESLVREVAQDYQDSLAVDETTEGAQKMQRGKDQFSEIRLVGARVTKYWASKEGTLYALVVLERDGISATLSRVPTLTPAMREDVTKRAERLFDELKQRSANQ